MNNTFNFKRFGLLMKRQWLEFGKIYLISLGIVAGVIIASYGLYYFRFIENEGMKNVLVPDLRVVLFFILGTLFLTIAANTQFSQLGQKSKLIVDLMVPASTLEKFLTGLFFSVILAFLSYLLVFCLIDFALVSELKNTSHSEALQMNDAGQLVMGKYNPAYFFEKNSNMIIQIASVPILISSLFFLGSVYFTKHQYVKTMISLMVFSGLWITFTAYTNKYIFHDKVISGDFKWIVYIHKTEWWIALYIVLSVFFWAITYVRLREKEG
ncbi:hypothetical protein [Arcticibacter eurypsychrophilus]|uniref:hypothetical protein n=1 Tax=Arcticibacter eurypsychrophilus TaxID=1434752 RepID=UPI00084DB2BF|nr:hypothetical protein [Arcticibacter eurypsychrophilus]